VCELPEDLEKAHEDVLGQESVTMILVLMESYRRRVNRSCLQYSWREFQDDLHDQEPPGAEWLANDQASSGVIYLPREEGGAHQSY
jgi:hypothetical protein